MKLLREVKSNERTPDREQFYIAHHKEGVVMYLCWIPEHEVWEDADEYQYGTQEITSWLEPIEITEGEISEILYDSFRFRDYGEGEQLAVKAILSKLK